MAIDGEPGQDQKQARFEDLLDFPTEFKFRVVCEARPGIAAQVTACLERLTGSTAAVRSTQPSRNGTWTVYRVETVVQSAVQIRTAYSELAAVEGVRMVL
jgi:putative lipoic acid-binding regulatory protein